MKVGSDPLFQVFRLADIQDVSVRIEHPVNTGKVRQASRDRRSVELAFRADAIISGLLINHA
jgi:hypothetical protein